MFYTQEGWIKVHYYLKLFVQTSSVTNQNSTKLILKKHLRKMLESYHFIENNYNKQTLKLFW